MRAALIVVLLALSSACAAPLRGADLQAAPLHDGAPLAVAVSAASASQDLCWRAEAVDTGQSVVVLRIHVLNQSRARQEVDPAGFRLSVTAAGGQSVTAVPTAAGLGELPHYASSKQLSPLFLAPGEQTQIWVQFQGFAGLPLVSAARIQLLVPGEGGHAPAALTLADPTGPAPRWLLWNMAAAIGLHAGVVTTPGRSSDSWGLDFTWAHDGLIFGLHTVSGLVERDRGSDRTRFGFGLGPFVGYLPERLPGVVVGVDGLTLMAGRDEDAPVSGSDAYVLRPYAAIRIELGHDTGPGGGVLPLQHRHPSRLRSYILDIGYVHSFTSGPLRSGSGFMLVLGARLFGV